jgi:phosphonate transport system substrate-binding protein
MLANWTAKRLDWGEVFHDFSPVSLERPAAMDTASVSEGASAPKSSVSFSLVRVLVVLAPVVALVLAYYFYQNNEIVADQRRIEAKIVNKFGLGKPTQNRLDSRFTDADGDMLADVPQGEGDLIDPDRLVFSYVGGKDSERQQEVWQPFVAFLAEQTGKPVEYLVLESPEEQLDALKQGKLHVAGVNTGNVPMAVNRCGFVPVCTMGAKDGSFGYTMKLIVPADSKLAKVEDIRGHRIALTDHLSNSGYKAPLVLLMYDFGLQPERDFEWSFTFGHDESIRGISVGDYEVAAVASDLLARAEARGDIKPDQYKVIYTSERFPPVALGYMYNLQPELAEKVKASFDSFAWAGTALETEFAEGDQNAFVSVNYKDDWSLVRRIDDAMGAVYVGP